MTNVKTVFKYMDSGFREKLNNSKAFLTISVGQEAHEGERLASTMGLINSTFSSCVISLCDSLQRHTMGLLKMEDADSFYKQSMEEGDFWILRNESHYNKLTIPKNIIR